MDNDHKRPWHRTSFVVLIGLAAFHAWLMAAQEVLPFIDLPFRLSAATIVRHYADAANDFSQFFSLAPFGNPNVFFLRFASLPVFPSVEVAAKIYLAVYAFALPISVWLVIRRLDGDPWYALLSFFFLYNFNTHWGFVGFMMALPLTMLLFLLLIEHAARPRWTTGVALGIGVFAMFFVHLIATLYLVLLIGLVSITAHRWAWRPALFTLAPVIPTTLFVFVWAMGAEAQTEGSALGYLPRYYTSLFLPRFALRATLLSHDNSFLYPGMLGIVVGGLFGALAGAPGAYAFLRNRSALKSFFGKPEGRVVMGAVLASAACWFFAPSQLPGLSWVYTRFAVVVLLWLVIVSSVAPVRDAIRPVMLGLVGLGLVGHAIIYTQYFGEFSRENEGFDQVLPQDGGSMAAMIYDYQYRGNPSYIHFPDYYITRKHGIATTSLSDFSWYNVRRRVGEAALPKYLEWIGSEGEYDGRYAGMDYLLVRGRLPQHVESSFPHLAEVSRRNAWVLYQVSP